MLGDACWGFSLAISPNGDKAMSLCHAAKPPCESVSEGSARSLSASDSTSGLAVVRVARAAALERGFAGCWMDLCAKFPL